MLWIMCAASSAGLANWRSAMSIPWCFPELSTCDWPGLVPAFGEAKSVATVPIRDLLRAESYDEMFVSNSSEMNDYRLSLLRAVCESPRFRGLRVGEYAERLDEGEQQQFAAMAFDLGADFGLYVAFRGTDGTLVGWKEDFNMAVRCPVPSQESAYRYADSIWTGRNVSSRRKITRHYDRRAFQRRQYGGICGHANHAKRY